MKLFIAGLSTETNSFSPLPTGMLSFTEGSIHHGDATQDVQHYWTGPLFIWRDRAEALRDPLFWMMVPAMLGPGAFATAFFFHQVLLADIKGWSHVELVALFVRPTAG